MPNNYFQFKQFTVYQDACAMKVCTDACLFGGLVAGLPNQPQRILDIGTGTGLLALMCAQQYPAAKVDAVEIDGATAQQAEANFAASPWAGRLAMWHTPIQLFNPPLGYDLIISNPPFFENDLKSVDAKRNLALHSQALDLATLVEVMDRLLNDGGVFGVLLPYHRTGYFEQLALDMNFQIHQKILVKQTPKHQYFRSILFYTRHGAGMKEREIVIKDNQRNYTTDFKVLLNDYYLHL